MRPSPTMMPARNRFFRTVLLLAIGAMLLGAVVCVIEPWFNTSGVSSFSTLHRSFNVLTGLWFFFLGSCLGSFLNVVVYRLPRGMSLLGTSQCPFCKNAIAPRDNIPIFAWLNLRGVCRDCQLPVAARYPVVEFVVALLVLSLAVVEVALGGANLSIESEGAFSGFTYNLFDPDWPLVLSLVWHSFVGMVLLAMALMLLDGARLPSSLILVSLASVVVIALLHPSTLYTVRHPPSELSLPLTFRDLVSAGFVGWLIGFGLSFDERARGLVNYAGYPWMFAVVGAAFGWPAVVFCGIAAPLLELLQRWFGHQEEEPSINLVAVLFFYLICGYPLLYGFLRVMPF